MSGVGAKLSRHVLGMKFMRNSSKNQINKSDKASIASTGASPSSSSVKTEPSKVKNEPSATQPLVVEELWSYNQCERYIFGRQSFGGFNPSVEKNLKKGVWKPFYLDDGEHHIESSDDEDAKKQSDVDVSDEEMAKTYGSLIGTLAKRFRGKDKKNKNFKGKGNNNRKPKWNKGFQKKKGEGNADEEMDGRQGNRKRQRESTGSNYHDEDRNYQNSPSARRKRGHDGDDDDNDVPAQKQRKFLKPSD